MKKLYILGLFALASGCFFGSCNDEWEDELYSQMLSFKAPVESAREGVCDIYMRYKENGEASYDLPIIVSGSRDNDRDYDVKIAVDPDTLDILNVENFNEREDLYYLLLPEQYYTIPETVHIPAGVNTQTFPIEFNFTGIDLNREYVLPLTILPDASYAQNLRKGYYKALLRINLFNDYSGSYASGGMMTFLDGSTSDGASVTTRVAKVVSENEVFFYAGTVWDEDLERANYQYIVEFGEGTVDEDGIVTGPLTLRSFDSANKMQLEMSGTCSYRYEVQPHATKPYLERHMTTLYLDYKYTDFTTDEENPMRYHVTGNMSMDRQINILIPDEDQAIQW